MSDLLNTTTAAKVDAKAVEDANWKRLLDEHVDLFGTPEEIADLILSADDPMQKVRKLVVGCDDDERILAIAKAMQARCQYDIKAQADAEFAVYCLEMLTELESYAAQTSDERFARRLKCWERDVRLSTREA